MCTMYLGKGVAAVLCLVQRVHLVHRAKLVAHHSEAERLPHGLRGAGQLRCYGSNLLRVGDTQLVVSGLAEVHVALETGPQ